MGTNINAAKRYKDINLPFICPLNNRTFNSTKGLSVYVTKTLKMDHKQYYDTYIDHRDRSCFFCGTEGLFMSVGKGYRNLCTKSECLHKSNISHSVEGIMYRSFVSREEAEKLFDVENQKQLQKRKKTNEELRKIDPLWDKKRSRNCKEFWMYKGFSEEDSILKSVEVMSEIHQKTFLKFKSDPLKYRSKNTTTTEYYLKKGYSEDIAIKMLSDRQSTFSKEICIGKYGEEEGLNIWNDRQIKWQKSLSKNGNAKGGYSKISQKLFWDLLMTYSEYERIDVFFHTKNYEVILKSKSIYLYDFTDTKRMKMIEYNGDQYHANPYIYKPDDTPHPYHKTKKYCASKIWEKDENKIELAKFNGYEVLVVWDSEYRKNPKQTVEKCIEFLNN